SHNNPDEFIIMPELIVVDFPLSKIRHINLDYFHFITEQSKLKSKSNEKLKAKIEPIEVLIPLLGNYKINTIFIDPGAENFKKTKDLTLFHNMNISKNGKNGFNIQSLIYSKELGLEAQKVIILLISEILWNSPKKIDNISDFGPNFDWKYFSKAAEMNLFELDPSTSLNNLNLELWFKASSIDEIDETITHLTGFIEKIYENKSILEDLISELKIRKQNLNL
ncbi:MAG: hypothetical protein ACTSWY_09265, partial [Promethearchaeota archaeon]